MLTFGDMKSSVIETINESSPRFVSMAARQINAHYKRIAKLPEHEEDLKAWVAETFTYVADKPYLALPADCAIPLKIADLDNDWVLQRRDLENLLEDYVRDINLTTGNIIYYASLGYQATKAPLSANVGIDIFDESTDDKSVEVHIKGLRASPEIEDRETITTNATDGTTVTSGTVTWRAGWSIHSISTSAKLNGYIEIGEQSTTGNVLAYLTKDKPESRYFVIQLQTAPSSANNLRIQYKRRVLDMVDDDEIPLIDDSDAIIEAAIASIRRFQDRYSQAREHDAVSRSFLASTTAEQKGRAASVHRTRPASRLWYRPKGIR